MAAATADDDVEVLEFRLGSETYCVDIEYVAEIVERDEMTAVPNTADHVEGLMDLRGEATAIVDPVSLLETGDVSPADLVADGGTGRDRVVVLDGDTVDTDGATGWLVSDVNEVTAVSEDAVETEVVDDSEVLRGVIKEDDRFVLWVDPHEMTA
jgi:purine-binding chemotaxis protein CheW